MGPAGHTEETLQGGDQIGSECQQGRQWTCGVWMGSSGKAGRRPWQGCCEDSGETGALTCAPHPGCWEPPLTHMADVPTTSDLRINTVYPPGATLPPKEKSFQLQC